MAKKCKYMKKRERETVCLYDKEKCCVVHFSAYGACPMKYKTIQEGLER